MASDSRASLIRDASSLTRFDAARIKRDLMVHKIAELASTAAANRSQALELSAALDAATKQTEDCRSQNAELAAQVALSTAEADRLAQAAAHAARRLDDLYQSRSWRWTAAARAVYAVLERMVR
jgi:hypothetical protein